MSTILADSTMAQATIWRSQKAILLVDPSTGKMECRFCGSVHYASIKPCSGGLYYRGSWQCLDPNCPSKTR
jgi:hypothetical protein